MNTNNLHETEETWTTRGQQDLQRKDNNLRLTQAINYLADEGGDDSPLTYMARVNRIGETLVQNLPQCGQNFDKKLWSKVRSMVSAVQRDFENTAKQIGSPPEKQYVVELEREFNYGSVYSEPEHWYQDMPAYLPIPETFRMAHWESLKIDYDLSNSSSKLQINGEAAKTNVSFHHDALKHYDNLSHYESGSHFQLPDANPSDYAAICKMTKAANLRADVRHFNLGNRTQQEIKNYVPRTFFPRFGIGKQTSPRDSPASAVRKSLNTTPSKPPRSNTSNVSTSSRIATANARLQAMQQELQFLQNTIKRTSISSLDSNTKGYSDLETPTHKRRKINTNPGTPLRSAPHKTGPALRKFAIQRAQALRSSPRRESLPEGHPGSPGAISPYAKPPSDSRSKTKSPTVATLSHVAIPSKRPPIRTHSTTAPGLSSPKDAQAHSHVSSLVPHANTSNSSPVSQRKHSLGNSPYAPSAKRIHISPATARPLRSASRSGASSTPKRVEFINISSASDEGGDGDDDHGSDVTSTQPKHATRRRDSGKQNPLALTGSKHVAENSRATRRTKN